MSDDLLAQTVARMSSTLLHRGPDSGGAWVDAAAGIALGHRRLSIIDLSPEGHQPMVSSCGRYVIVFNGEIYNFRELREELGTRGHSFRGRSDTEVLLAAVSEWGLQAAVRRCVGMFAFALWDRATRSLALARDRLGEKPLYYGWAGASLLFGSELKALRRHPSWSSEIDRGVLALYLRHSYVPAPYSIYRGIRKLIPGCIVEFQGAAAGVLPDPVPYWSLRDIALRGATRPYGASESDAADELERLIRAAVRQQMVADVPVGAFLSGGVDSSTVVALMQAESTGTVKTFSIGLLEHGYNEADYARAVARHLGTDHTELCVTPAEAMAVVPQLPMLYDEPFADSSQIPTYLVACLARQQVTVSLSGDGGDELFGGYPRYTAVPRLWNKLRRLPPAAARQASALLGLWADRNWASLTSRERARRLAEVLQGGYPEATHRAFLSSWVFPSGVVLGAEEPPTAFTDARHHLGALDVADRMMYLDLLSYLPDDLLVKVDRAAMGTSLETRIPLLDHRIVEFAWQLPRSMKINRGETKRLLRQVLYRYVPRELIERPKMGFGIPLGEWLRGPLRDWAEGLLDEQRIRNDGFFDPAPIQARWQEHVGGEHNWQYPLWSVLMFNAWLANENADQQRAPELRDFARVAG